METRSILTIQIEDALEKATECPLCYLTEKSETRFIETFYSEWIMDPGCRANVLRSRGFCNYHLHQLLRFTENHPEKHGLAIILEDLVRDRLKSLERLCDDDHNPIGIGSQADLLATLKHLLLGRTPESLHRFAQEVFVNLSHMESLCPACLSLSESDRSNCQTMIRMMVEDQGFRIIFKESNGLCLPHLTELMRFASERLDRQSFSSVVEILLPLQVKRFKRLKFELSEFIRKQDYRFRKEGFGPEFDVVERTILKLIGSPCHGSIQRRIMNLTDTDLDSQIESSKKCEGRRTGQNRVHCCASTVHGSAPRTDEES